MRDLAAKEHAYVDSGGTAHKEASPENIMQTRKSLQQAQ